MTYSNIRNLALTVALVGFFVEEIHAQSLNMTSAIRLGGTGNDDGTRIAVDAAGNVYFTGTLSGPVDIDPGPATVMIGPGAFVAKYSPTGTLIWARNHVAVVASSYTLTVDAAGNVYTAGWFSGTCDFDPGPGTSNITAVAGPNMFVSKLDSAGNFVWAKGFLGGTATPSSLAVDAAGNVYTAGYLWSGTIDFDPGAGTLNLTALGNQLFISKLDSTGNFVWALEFAGTQALNGNGLALDAAGNVYATANFQGTVDLDPGAGVANFTAAIRDPFVVKLTPAGTYVWAKQFVGGIGGGFASDIAVDAAGNVHTTGYFVGTVDFDPGPGTSTLTDVSGGVYDVYVSKLDSNGNFVWARRLGGTGDDHPAAITVDSKGNVYTIGYFGLLTPTGDFDPGPGTFTLTAVGTADVFISMLDSSGNFVAAVSIGSVGAWNKGNHIAASPLGNVYAIGNFSLTADFDTGAGTLNLTSAGADDIFVIGLQGSGGGPGPGPGPGPIPVTNEGSYAGSTGTGPGSTEGSFGFGARAASLTSQAGNDLAVITDNSLAIPRLHGPFLNTPDGQKRSLAVPRLEPGASVRVLNAAHQQSPPSAASASGWRIAGYAVLAAIALALAVGLARTAAARLGSQYTEVTRKIPSC